MGDLLPAFLMTSVAPTVIGVVCAVTTVLVFLRQGELGGAALVAGLGFAALAAASAVQIAMLYVQFSGVAHHQPAREIAQAIGIGSLAGKVLEIGGIVLVAVAMLQRRPAETRTMV